jgi:23S rRNA pseudouridine2604 synthase
MCEHLGYEVTSLKRVRILNIMLGDLKEGEHRNVTKEERKALFEMIKDSDE